MRLHLAMIPFLVATLSSCASSGWYDYGFEPAPFEAKVESEAVAGSQVRALVSVLGIERGQDGAADAAVIRMRLENLGTAPARLLPDELELLSSDIVTLGPATVIPSESKPLAAGESADCDARFPLPTGKHPADLDLQGMILSFAVAFGDQVVTTSANFRRLIWRQGYDDPQVHVGVGFGWVHH